MIISDNILQDGNEFKNMGIAVCKQMYNGTSDQIKNNTVHESNCRAEGHHK